MHKTIVCHQHTSSRECCVLLETEMLPQSSQPQDADSCKNVNVFVKSSSDQGTNLVLKMRSSWHKAAEHHM